MPAVAPPKGQGRDFARRHELATGGCPLRTRSAAAQRQGTQRLRQGRLALNGPRWTGYGRITRCDTGGVAREGCHQAYNRLSIDGEAVKQTITARAPQGFLAAATTRAARWMRRIPGFGGIVVAQALAVVVADHGRPLAAAGPVATGHIIATSKRPAIHLRAGQDIVHIRGVAPAIDGFALLGQRRLLVEIVRAVEFVHIFRNDHTFGIFPGPLPDAITGVERGLTA